MLPDRLYEAKPALCAVFGIIAAMAADNAVGSASGLLLLTAGAMIFRLRWGYRRSR